MILAMKNGLQNETFRIDYIRRYKSGIYAVLNYYINICTWLAIYLLINLLLIKLTCYIIYEMKQMKLIRVGNF